MRTIAIFSLLAASSAAAALAQPKPAPPARVGKPNPNAAAPVDRPAVARPNAPPAVANTRNADELAIRQTVDAVAKAYNAADAKKLASLFTADGEIVDEEGAVSQGREAIEQVFAGIFQEFPRAQMQIDVESIRFLSPGLAIEDGITKVIHVPGQPAELSRYSVTHLKQDGRWQMASARDISDNEAQAAELEQLGWLIGDWVDESNDAVMKTSYRWTDNHHYILSDFTMQIGGRPAMTGSQRIGWDPLAKQVHSWVFDSEGGFAQGLWTLDGDRWIVKLSGVTREGRVGSATNVFTRLGPDKFTFESHDRVVGNEPAEETAAIVVVRQPPKPGN